MRASPLRRRCCGRKRDCCCKHEWSRKYAHPCVCVRVCVCVCVCVCVWMKANASIFALEVRKWRNETKRVTRWPERPRRNARLRCAIRLGLRFPRFYIDIRSPIVVPFYSRLSFHFPLSLPPLLSLLSLPIHDRLWMSIIPGCLFPSPALSASARTQMFFVSNYCASAYQNWLHSLRYPCPRAVS